MAVNITGLKEFNLDIKEFVEKTEVDFATAMKKVSMDVFTGIVKKTPVDTGRARASWNIAINTPDMSVPPPREGKTTAITGFLTPGEKVAALSKLAPLDKDPYVTVWITSNLDYIVPLENGHSKQAPSGMVALTVTEMEKFMEEALRDL